MQASTIELITGSEMYPPLKKKTEKPANIAIATYLCKSTLTETREYKKKADTSLILYR